VYCELQYHTADEVQLCTVTCSITQLMKLCTVYCDLQYHTADEVQLCTVSCSITQLMKLNCVL